MRKIKVIIFSICLGMIVLMIYVEPSYPLTPTVKSVTPNKGTTNSTQDVTIKGSNFEADAKVSLLNGGPFLAGA